MSPSGVSRRRFERWRALPARPQETRRTGSGFAGRPRTRTPRVPCARIPTWSPGYRQRRTADDGSPWIWSTSSVGYRRIEVRAGETDARELRDWIGLRTVAHSSEGQAQCRPALPGREEAGQLALSQRQSHRDPLAVLDAAGQCWARARWATDEAVAPGLWYSPPKGTAEAHFVFPTPPFELVGELSLPFEPEDEEASSDE